MTRRVPRLLLLAPLGLAACSSPPRAPRPAPLDVGYVQWISERPWGLGDLAAAAASYDQLCLRAEAGDAEARELAALVGPSLWLARTLILPLLRTLPGAEDVLPDEQLATSCPAAPDPALAAALEDLAEPDAAQRAVERLLAIERDGIAAGLADDARLARVTLAVSMLAPSAGLVAAPQLAAQVRILDPYGMLLVSADDAGGPCADAPAEPECAWERLTVQALADTAGADTVNRALLTPEARDVLARRGLVDLVARAVVTVVEDQSSNLRLLAAELVARLSRALGIGEGDIPEGEAGGEAGGESWPEAAP
jgi:hypothetical protein